MEMTIMTEDLTVLEKLMEGNSIVEDVPVELPNGISITYKGSVDRGFVEGLSELVFLVDYIDDVSVGIFSAWLYDKLKKGVDSLKINGKDTKISTKDIEDSLNT